MPDQIQTVGDMFRALEQEIRDVKDGKLPLDTARVVQRGRYLQLKTAELNLMNKRISRAQHGEGKEMNLLTGSVEHIAGENKVV